ncbi:MAG: NAD-binding protein, partial [Clostridia bacterium]|nr:NAD-binding protein [Clostridia bacterium]
SRRNFEMVELIIREDSNLDGMSLIDLRKKYKANFLICVVKRGEEIYIPDGNFVLKNGDHICLTANFTEIQKLLKMLGLSKKHSKNVMVLGATTTAFYLSKMLLKSGSDVTIIDKDISRCNQFAEKLPNAVVINGDGAQQEVLMEEGITSVDAFAALTGMDEENILISFFAQSQNVPRVVAKVNRNELSSMAEKLGLDSIVSPKKAVSNVITSYARALQNSLGSNVETMYKLMDGSVEALEFNVQADFKGQRISLKDIQLKDDVLIAGIIRKRKAFIPTGDDEIVAGDKIIVIAKSREQKMNDLADILR